MCPDKKVTREIASKRSLKLWPLVCIVDEAQNLFAHAKFGKQAGDDATFIIKIGRALGVILVLATQRPDQGSLPTGVIRERRRRGSASRSWTRSRTTWCSAPRPTRTGSGRPRSAPRSTPGSATSRARSSQPQVVRTYYLNMDATERVAKRARALREAAGTLSGVALGEDDSAPQRDVLADVLEVFGGDNGLQWPALAERLAARFPERWDGATGDAVSAELRARGVRSVDVKADGEARKGCRRADVETAAGR